MNVEDLTPEELAERLEAQRKRSARYAELNKISKAKLCDMLRAGGLVWSLHPPEKWLKQEVINGIIDQEEIQEKAAQVADEPCPGKDTRQGESTQANQCRCGADEDPDGETMCVCDAIAAEPAPDPREEEECTPELIDGQVIGCGVCEGCRS